MPNIHRMIYFEGDNYTHIKDEKWKEFVCEVCASLYVIEDKIRRYREAAIRINPDKTFLIQNIPDETLVTKISNILSGRKLNLLQKQI